MPLASASVLPLLLLAKRARSALLSRQLTASDTGLWLAGSRMPARAGR